MIVYIFRVLETTHGLFVSESDLGRDEYTTYFVRYGFAKSEVFDVPTFLSIIGDSVNHVLLLEVVWFSRNVIEPLSACLAPSSSSTSTAAGHVILNTEFFDASENCKALVASHLDQEMQSNVWIHKALSNLAKLSASRSHANPDTWPCEYLSLDTMSMATFRKRHKIESTACEPPTLTETKRRNALVAANGGVKKRKRATYQSSGVPDIDYYICLADVREVIKTRVAQYISGSSLYKLADILMHGVPDGAMWLLKYPGLILSKQDTPFVKCPVDNTSAETIDSAYIAVSSMSRQLCLVPTISTCPPDSNDYEHLDYCARVVLLTEFVDAVNRVVYPIDFQHGAPLASIIEVAINAKLIDIMTGRGDLCCLCYLPAKSAIVDGCETIRASFERRYGPNVKLTAEPSNYLCFYNFAKSDPKPVSMKRSVISYYFGDVVPSSTLYTVFANCIKTTKPRYMGFLVIVGQVYVEYLDGLDDDSAWSAFCDHFSLSKETARKKRANAQQQQPQTFSAAVQVKRVQIENFMKTNKDVPLTWKRQQLRPGQLMIVSYRSPLRVQPVFADLDVALCAELEYYPFNYLSAIEHEDRTKSLLSTNVRVRVNKQISNGYEWTASCLITAGWKSVGATFHPYTVITQAGDPIYYQHLPSRVIDELRGVRLYTDMYAILDQPK